MRILSVLVIPMLFASAVQASPRLGAATVRADSTACVSFRGEPMPPGVHLYFILFSPPRVVDGTLGQAAQKACNPAVPQEGQAYDVRLRYAVSDTDELAIAVADPTARVEFIDGEFVVHTKDTVNPLEFERCTSHEGVHLSAWRGSRRTWEEYWYLGYDVEPTCPDEEGKD
jgi:hypothetical protein